MILQCLRRRDWLLITIGIILLAAQAFFDLRIPEYMSGITNALQAGDSTDLARRFGYPMIACAAISFVSSLGASAAIIYATADLGRALRERQFVQVQRFSAENIAHFSPASLITRSTNDVYQLQRFLSNGLVIIVSAPLLASWALYKISKSTWQWTAATAAAAVILLLIISVAMWITTKYFRRIQWLTDDINREVKDELEGMRTIRAYNAKEHQDEKFRQYSDELLDNNLIAFRNMAIMFPLASAVVNYLILTIYWIGLDLITAAPDSAAQAVLFSDMIVFSSYAQYIMTSFIRLSQVMRGLPRALVCYRRIREVVETAPTVADGTGEATSEQQGEIEFDQVSFTYPGAAEPALRDISLHVHRGETVAVVGASGSGKTTLINLILRQYDATAGHVRIDGTDVQNYREEELHAKMGYVSQQTVIFPGTIRENVAFDGDHIGHSDEEVARALRIAQATDFVNLQTGLDADVYQNGRNLSGGQKQRLAIARAVCRDPEFYLLDDSFSALDLRTDQAVRVALRHEEQGATILVVAQRIGSVRNADRIIVLDGGRMVGNGRHADLLRTCAIYREIAASQLTEEDRR